MSFYKRVKLLILQKKKKKKTVWKDASRAVKATSDHLKVPPKVNEWIKQIAFNEYNPEK